MSGNDTNNEFPPGENGEAGADAPLNTSKPAVAAAPGKVMIVVVLAGVFILVIIHSLFFGEKPEPKKEVQHRKEQVTAEGTRAQNELAISTGSLPTPPSMEVANTASVPPPPPPPPPPALLTPPSPEMHAAGGANDEALSKRIHSPMLTMSGTSKISGVTSDITKHNAAVSPSSDPNSAFAQSVSQTQADTVKAGKIENLSITIAQGKLIQAVLESAIDSSLPGPIRAIVSHDTYAESGRAILIPKGSRLIGTYNAAIRRGQSRVFIVWQRVIRPDGIDIMIDSPGVDALGRAGMGGDVDNKYFEMFSSAIMTSALDIGVAAAGDALFGNQQTTTTNNGTGSSTTESPTSTAMQTAVQNVSNVGSNIVNNALNTTPTIYIDQGTSINVFVNRDLIFPSGVNSNFIE